MKLLFLLLLLALTSCGIHQPNHNYINAQKQSYLMDLTQDMNDRMHDMDEQEYRDEEEPAEQEPEEIYEFE